MDRKSIALFAALLVVSGVSTANAQISTREQQAEQDAIDAKTPKLNYKEDVLQLLVPGYTMGETVGVDVNSQNHIFVYSRTNPQGIARGGTAAMLWEFDQSGTFVKEWGPHNYAASFAHSVRVDKHDNVWQVDEGSGMIVKYSPQALPLEQFGRTPEAIDYLEQAVEKQGRGYEGTARRLENPIDLQHLLHPDGGVGTFNRPTDVAWDSHDNVFVTDGYGNSRLVKIAPGGHSGTQVIYSSDGTSGRLYKIDLTSGKVLGWAQTSLGRGEDDAGRLVHEIGCKDPSVVYLGSAILWNVTKVTITP